MSVEELAETVPVVFEPDEVHRLQDLAERNGMSVAALVQQIVQGYLRFR